LDTAAGTNFSLAWSGCSSLTSFPLLNTAAGTDFSGAWYLCSSLTSFPLLNTAAGTDFSGAWSGCTRLTTFPLLNFGNMKNAGKLFSRVTLTSSSYDDLLSHIAASNTISKVKFDGGLSKASSVSGIQAREKLKSLGWTIYDGDNPVPKPRQKNKPPQVSPPKPEEVNDF
jgi:hypothetical protein